MATINNRFENLTLERLQEIYDLVLAVPTATVWGSITGTLSLQLDLQAALNGKFSNPAGTISQYIRGDGTLANFPSVSLTVSATPITSGTIGRVLFQGAGNVLQENTNVNIGTTGNLLLGGVADDGVNALQITGGQAMTGDLRIIGGAYANANVGSDPHQLTTKEYVDNSVTAGLHVHEPVRVESESNLTATYVDGGTTPVITAIASSSILTSVGHSLIENDLIVFSSTANGIIAGDTYFVFQVFSADTFTISTTINGPAITTLTNGTGLSIGSRANSGVGATLTNAGAQAALVVGTLTLAINDRVLVTGQTTTFQNGVYVVSNTGSPSTNWVLTRASDANKYGSTDPNYLGGGDYFFVTSGNPGAGRSYVLTTNTEIVFGTTGIVFTQFSAAPTYSGTAPINISGQIISISQATTSTNGYLSNTDWNTFNGKQDALVSGTNIKTINTATLLGSGNIAVEPTITAGTISQYWRGDKTWQTFPTIPTVTPSALTKTDDTNVTLTLGGTPGTSLLEAVSLTLGWTGTLADARIASATNWNTAYTNRITSLTTTGTGAATLISNVLNIPTPSAATFSSLTTTGLSGSSTLLSGVLNVPTYTLSGLGGQPLATNLTSLSGLTYASTSFLKMTAAGTFGLDTNTYLTGNQSITLSGDISGTGSTSITTAIGTNKVTNAMLAQVVTSSFLGRVTAGTGDVETLTGTQATTLLDTFSSTLKGLAPASGGGTTNFLRADGTWAAPGGGGGGTPGGTTGQVQYNNAGVFAGATNVKIDANGNLNLAVDAAPPVAPTDTLTIFDMKVGGRNMLSIVGPAGVDNVMQTHIARNGTSVWSAAGNSTTITAIGNAALSATGNATTANIAVTNVYTRMKRLEYLVTTASATAVAGFRAPANQWWMGNAADSGGFHFICRFGPATGVATASSRMFVGMTTATNAPTDVNPSTLTNFFGVGYDSTDTSLQFMHNAASTTNKLPLVSFPVPTTDRTIMYELAMFCAPNSTSLSFTVTNLATGVATSGTVTNNLPNANTLMSPRGWCSAGGTSSVIGIALSSLYLETDY